MRDQPKFKTHKGNLPPMRRTARPTVPLRPVTKKLPPRRAR
jgi:hypothetical protein